MHTRKFLHPQELEQYRSIKLDSHKNTFLASRYVRHMPSLKRLTRLRWSTKEAAYKAFGKWRIPFYDMKVTYAEKGVPRLEFDGMAKEVAEQNNIGKAHVSISHDHEYAIAYVILEKLEK